MGLQVSPTPLCIFASDRDKKYVTAYGDTVYYGSTSGVSSASPLGVNNYEGTIANGETYALATSKWFVTAPDVGLAYPGSARLEVVDRDEAEERLLAIEAALATAGGAGLGANTMGVVVYDEDMAAWPQRPDDATAVIWVGADAPGIGGVGGAVDGVDMWIPTIEDT